MVDSSSFRRMNLDYKHEDYTGSNSASNANNVLETVDDESLFRYGRWMKCASLHSHLLERGLVFMGSRSCQKSGAKFWSNRSTLSLIPMRLSRI